MGPGGLTARPDKWYLGAGDGLIWAPPFPLWLDAPGFWDEAHLFQYAVAPLFTLSFVQGGEGGAGGAVLPTRCLSRTWVPGTLTVDHAIGPLRARETRFADGSALYSAWVLRNPTATAVTLDVVAWTAVDGASLAAPDVRADGAALHFTWSVTDRQSHTARIAAALGMSPRAGSYAAYRSQRSAPAATHPPDFRLTPFFDRWQANGRLRGELHLGGLDETGVVYLGVQRRLRIAPTARAKVEARMALDLVGPKSPSNRPTARPPDILASAPSFRCSDPYLEAHWAYRWYGLKFNAIGGGVGNYRHPTVCEGIAYFHVPISYSAQCHMRELRWLADPTWARGVLRTFLDHQKPDGSFHGRIYADHLQGTAFYHADWGGALLGLDAVHPDPQFLAEVYPGLARYAEWLLGTRDAAGTGMIDVVDQYETGQEYMSRYQAVDPEADRYGWENRIRLKGIDVTVYAYRLFRALEHIARAAQPADAARWGAAADRTARAVRDTMWDPAAEMFFDVDPATGRRTGVKAAVCFYPYMTDLTDAGHAAGLGRHLFDRREFWTPFPVPSSSVDDPLFDPNAEWKGKRHNCPWNGRVWPMTNSHVADALARVVRAHRPDWAPRLGELLCRFARMMTFGGRADRPNCFEHYHPYTGRPSVYRGIDDYQHSWVNDLLVSHLVGVLPHGATGVTIHPLRLGVARAVVDDLPVARGRHRLRVAVDGARFSVRVDGRAAGRGRVGEPLTIAF